MFIRAFIVAIILGYLLGGRLKNLEFFDVSGLYIIIVGFLIEAALHFLVVWGMIQIGPVTYFLNFMMYMLIAVFTIINRRNIPIIIMGVGFLLNAIVIFLNGGVMPVGKKAMEAVALPQNISSEGLYSVVNSKTRLSFLSDVIPMKYIGHYAVSIGDIISALGLMILIVSAMKMKSPKPE